MLGQVFPNWCLVPENNNFMAQEKGVFKSWENPTLGRQCYWQLGILLRN